jgi:hypothetical protein
MRAGIHHDHCRYRQRMSRLRRRRVFASVIFAITAPQQRQNR